MPGGHEEVKIGRGWGGEVSGCTGRMRMGQGVAREERASETEASRIRFLISLLKASFFSFFFFFSEKTKTRKSKMSCRKQKQNDAADWSPGRRGGWLHG